jgi:hypothetical protein
METIYIVAFSHIALAGLVAIAFALSFRKTFLSSFLTGLLLTGLTTGLLLLLALRAKASISDTWEKPSYPVSTGLSWLPSFEKPTAEEAEEKGSLERKISRRSQEVHRELDAFTSSRAMRSLFNNDKRAYNRELFAEAERKVDALNSFIGQEIIRQLESGILSETVERDDHIDLQALKIDVSAAAFESTDSEPYDRPENLVLRDKPTLETLGVSQKLLSIPGPLGKAVARGLLDKGVQVWELEQQALETRQAELDADYEEADRLRLERLALQKNQFDAALIDFEKSAKSHNASIDMLIQGYAMGERTSVENYVAQVLNSSAYFDELAPRGFQAEFDESSQELSITVLLPKSSSLENVAVKCKLLKSRSAIEDAPVSKTDYKRLYSLVIMQLLIRAAHEVSEADRQNVIKSLSVVGTVQDRISTREVPIAMIAGRPQDFASSSLRGEVGNLFKTLGGTVSKDPVEGAEISLKGSIRGRD